MELGFYDLFTSYEMKLETHLHVRIENQVGFHELFIGYDMEVETRVHVQILNQLGFHELQLHAITSVY